MFTDSHSILVAALLLPGIYFICQAVALVMRLTLGRQRHLAWRIGAAVSAVLYTLMLSAHVTSMEHTFSQAAPAGDTTVAFTFSALPVIKKSDRHLRERLIVEITDCGFSRPSGAAFFPIPKTTQKPDLKGKPNDLIQPRHFDPYPSAG